MVLWYLPLWYQHLWRHTCGLYSRSWVGHTHSGVVLLLVKTWGLAERSAYVLLGFLLDNLHCFVLKERYGFVGSSDATHTWMLSLSTGCTACNTGWPHCNVTSWLSTRKQQCWSSHQPESLFTPKAACPSMAISAVHGNNERGCPGSPALGLSAWQFLHDSNLNLV